VSGYIARIGRTKGTAAAKKQGIITTDLHYRLLWEVS
jgi:hypothetical protein